MLLYALCLPTPRIVHSYATPICPPHALLLPTFPPSDIGCPAPFGTASCTTISRARLSPIELSGRRPASQGRVLCNLTCAVPNGDGKNGMAAPGWARLQHFGVIATLCSWVCSLLAARSPL